MLKRIISFETVLLSTGSFETYNIFFSLELKKINYALLSEGLFICNPSLMWSPVEMLFVKFVVPHLLLSPC